MIMGMVMTYHFLLLYALTVFTASMIPGPSMLLALTHGIQYGVKRTMASALGNVTVTLVQAAVSMAGLGTVLLASETVFQAIKYAGAAYLIYVGLTLFFSRPMDLSPGEDAERQEGASLKGMYLQAVLVTAGNPKAIVFFTAVFPQFINQHAPFIPQFMILLSLCAAIAFCCFMIYAVCGSRLIRIFQKGAVGRYVNKIIGGTFIGAGIGLAGSK